MNTILNTSPVHASIIAFRANSAVLCHYYAIYYGILPDWLDITSSFNGYVNLLRGRKTKSELAQPHNNQWMILLCGGRKGWCTTVQHSWDKSGGYCGKVASSQHPEPDYCWFLLTRTPSIQLARGIHHRPPIPIMISSGLNDSPSSRNEFMNERQ